MCHVIRLYVAAPEIILAEPFQQTLQLWKTFVNIFWFKPVALWTLSLTPQMEKILKSIQFISCIHPGKTP